MNYVTGQFVVLPRLLNLGTLKIKYTDILTYISLRSFDGNDGCFPSYESVANRADCSRDFIIKSIKRLEKAGVIHIKRNRKRVVKDRNPVNRYKFPSHYEFERIPFEIFDAELSLNDKAMLLNLRQFFFQRHIRPFHTLKAISAKLGLSYKIVHQRVESLISLGYLGKRKVNSKLCGYRYKYLFTDKVNWTWDFVKDSLAKSSGPLVLRLF